MPKRLVEALELALHFMRRGGALFRGGENGRHCSHAVSLIILSPTTMKIAQWLLKFWFSESSLISQRYCDVEMPIFKPVLVNTNEFHCIKKGKDRGKKDNDVSIDLTRKQDESARDSWLSANSMCVKRTFHCSTFYSLAYSSNLTHGSVGQSVGRSVSQLLGYWGFCSFRLFRVDFSSLPLYIQPHACKP